MKKFTFTVQGTIEIVPLEETPTNKDTQKNIVLRFLQKHPGTTSREILREVRRNGWPKCTSSSISATMKNLETQKDVQGDRSSSRIRWYLSRGRRAA